MLDHKTTLRIYELHESGHSMAAIARECMVSYDAVSGMLKRPGRYDPYLDEVAIERAMAGDAAVYQSLTVWEERELAKRLRPYVGPKGGQDETLTKLSVALGLEPKTLTSKIRREMERAA